MGKNRIYLYPMRNLADLEKKSPYMFNLTQGLREHCDIVNYGVGTRHGMLDTFKFFSKANVLYYNWPENIDWYQLPLFILIVFLSKITGKKLIWTHHNIHPHKGHTISSRLVVRIMRSWANMIIFHTRQSYQILNISEADNRVLEYFHPFFENTYTASNLPIRYDLLLWGNVRESKGVDQFLEYLVESGRIAAYRIKIIGKFSDERFYDRMKSTYAGYNKIVIENEFVENNKLRELHHQSKYVLFVYTGSSVLNSGALIKSLPWGTTIIGPNNAAFKELGEKKAILLYNDFSDIISILENTKPSCVDSQVIKDLVQRHTWQGFGQAFSAKIDTL